MPVEGQTIENIREMTDEEIEREGWRVGRHGKPMCLELEDGTVIFPSMDPEGNGPGELFGYDPDEDEGFFFTN